MRSKAERKLLEDILPRFDLTREQMERVLSEEREEYGIYSTLEKIADNPFILSEEYVGDNKDDFISFNKIDHGVFPSPDLGGGNFRGLERDDGRRLRALCVEQLRRESTNTFVSAKDLINRINHKLSYLPEWKRMHFTPRYLEVDADVLSEALTIRRKNDEDYVYLRKNYELERDVERILRGLAGRLDIEPRFPVTEEHWRSLLLVPDSTIRRKKPDVYDEVIDEQVEICQKVFTKPVSVISGGAGTGKTTIIRSMIQAIEKAHGGGTSLQLLAPTGKATDRLRDITGRSALTIHSFLASRGWQNDNRTLKLRGGLQEENLNTLIIDEASMLDLEVLGTLFRAINWETVERLIFVGDPNQLPPIGIGTVFVDLLGWLRRSFPGNVGILRTSVRQLLNRIEGRGTGILELASLFERKEMKEKKDSKAKFMGEGILRRVQEGGDIDKDLRVLYWKGLDDLETRLVSTLIGDLEADTDEEFNSERPFEIWAEAFKIHDKQPDPEYLQIISPYKGEFFGVYNINSWIQHRFNEGNMSKRGSLGGITVRDKVIQTTNRTRSNPIEAYNTQSRAKEKIELFNGEIGFVKLHGLDHRRSWRSFQLRRLQAIFKRKWHMWVEYNSGSAVEENLELAYAISVHKSQGSEFQRVYFVLPKKKTLLTTELLYTGITRARTHCTVLIEEDVSPLLSLESPEYSQINRTNSSLFTFEPVPEELQNMDPWYEEGKIHRTLADIMVQSKSEAIIANLLFDRNIPFRYDVPLFAPDGTFYRPDFVINYGGQDWYWEHLGMLDDERYLNHWEAKEEWYRRHGFSERLIVTDEKEGMDSTKIEKLILEHFP